MKKLLIIASLVLSASFVQAASVDWSGYGVAASKGVVTDTTKWTVTLMDSSVTSVDSLKVAFANASTDYSALSAAIAAGKIDTTTISSIGASFKSTATISDTTHSFYVLFMDSTLAADSTGHYVVTAAQTPAMADVGSGNLAFGDLSEATANWTTYSTGSAPVPEPTSAMLLIFGMAGLALRRRTVRKE